MPVACFPWFRASSCILGESGSVSSECVNFFVTRVPRSCDNFNPFILFVNRTVRLHLSCVSSSSNARLRRSRHPGSTTVPLSDINTGAVVHFLPTIITMADPQYAILALIPAAVAGLYFLLHRWRYSAYANIPTPLKSNLFLGHLGYIADEYKKAGSSSVHPGKHEDNVRQILSNTVHQIMSLRTYGKLMGRPSLCSSTPDQHNIHWL